MSEIPEDLKFLCVICKGRGKVARPGFSEEGGDTEVTCFPCKGKGWVWALNLEEMAERIAALEAKLAEAQGTVARLSAEISKEEAYSTVRGEGKHRFIYLTNLYALIAARLAPPQDAPQEKP